jgi:hypothetical protein
LRSSSEERSFENEEGQAHGRADHWRAQAGGTIEAWEKERGAFQSVDFKVAQKPASHRTLMEGVLCAITIIAVLTIVSRL